MPIYPQLLKAQKRVMLIVDRNCSPRFELKHKFITIFLPCPLVNTFDIMHFFPKIGIFMPTDTVGSRLEAEELAAN